MPAVLGVVLAVVLASVGPGAAPAVAAGSWAETGPAVSFSVQSRTSVPAGTSFSLTVSARDAAGAVVTSYRGRVGFASDDPRSPVVPGDYTFTEADRGVHTFRAELHTAGLWGIGVWDWDEDWVGGGTRVLVVAGPVAALAVWAPSRAVAGVPFDVRVAPVDAWRNWVTSYRGTIAFRSTDGKVRSLPSRYTFTAADRGSHTFPGATTLVSTGRFLVVAADTAQATLAGSAPVLVAGGGAAVEGQVLAGMDPLGGATVTAYDAVTGKRLGTVVLGPLQHGYRIGGLPAGGVKLGATHPDHRPDFANNVDTLAQATVFQLRPGQTLVQSWEAATFGPYLDLD